MLQLRDQRVLVVGAGKTGLAVAAFCHAQGATVTLTDKRTRAELQDALAALDPAITLSLGGHDTEVFLQAQLIVLSPGIPELAAVREARARQIPITGEIELASRFIEAPIIAITGTNGKSTVTALAGALAAQTGRPIFVGGNLGTPLITCVGTPAASREGIVVVELSSFQLETCETLRPRGAAILNITPDHLDRYSGMKAYVAAKLRIAQNQTPTDALVINLDDRTISGEVARAYPSLRPWSYSTVSGARDRGGFIDGDDLVLRLPKEERYPLSRFHLVGRHNLGNALAALLLLRSSDLCTYEQALAGLEGFRALPHRMERIAHKRSLTFFNDSKATNIESVLAGIDGFPTPFVLIAGGRDKGSPYQPLVAALRHNRCRGVVLIGEAADKISAAIGTQLPVARAASLEEAVATAIEMSLDGDAVVLSPACASYDMFDNYEHRGRMFTDIVKGLPE